MEKFITKSLKAEWEILYRDWKDTKFLTIYVAKKNCKKPFSHMSISFDELPTTNISKEISLDFSRVYGTDDIIWEESSEVSKEILEWVADNII